MRPRGHPVGDRMRGIDRKRSRFLYLGRRRVRMSEDEAGEPIRQSRLADALLTDQQKGVRNAVTTIGGKKRSFGAGIAVKCIGNEWRRRFVGFRSLCTHEATVSNSGEPLPSSNFSCTASQMRCATIFFGALASITMQRSFSVVASAK